MQIKRCAYKISKFGRKGYLCRAIFVLGFVGAVGGAVATIAYSDSTSIAMRETHPKGNHFSDFQSFKDNKTIVHTRVELEVERNESEKIVPGSEVDISLMKLADEGPKKNTILRNVKVHSVDRLEQKSPSEKQSSSVEASSQMQVSFLVDARQRDTIRLAQAQGVLGIRPVPARQAKGIAQQIIDNFTTNLFQPLLLFFFLGFLIPIFRVPFKFPPALYQSLTLYLLIAIGWHGGELMAQQSSSELAIAGGLAAIGFVTNGIIGLVATLILRTLTPMRQIDAVTVGAYYGSDSAGTFVTCLGILALLGISHDSYMPVMLAIMEIPGCLVGLFLVSRLRRQGMDINGNMPDETEYDVESVSIQPTPIKKESTRRDNTSENRVRKRGRFAAAINLQVLHEVFLNPGLFLLFGGIVVGFISGCQAFDNPHVLEGPDHLFLFIFKGVLCLFLLEMGMTASRHLADLRTAGWRFIAFGLLAPNLFATIGMLALHTYGIVLAHHFELGTYALFAVLCGAASYIAVPAVQRLAIPEASPTLPLAASLGLTFTWNVTLGIPIYVEIAKALVSNISIA